MLRIKDIYYINNKKKSKNQLKISTNNQFLFDVLNKFLSVIKFKKMLYKLNIKLIFYTNILKTKF